MGNRFGDSVLARRTGWMVERYADGELSEAQVAEAFAADVPAEEAIHRFRVFRRPIEEVGEYRELSPTRADVSVVCEGKQAVVKVLIEDGGDGRIRMTALGLAPAPGVTVREARPEDGPAIVALEQRCPVVTDGVATTYDRGPDYFAQHRLMGHHFQSVAEYEGRIVGTFADSHRTLRVAGRDVRATYRFHLRVDPSCRGMAIFPTLNAHQGELRAERAPGVGSLCVTSYQAAENAAVATTMGPEQLSMRWSLLMECLLLEAGGGEPAGRPATPEDAARVAALLYASHGREELAPVFDADHVVRRLSRSPGDYGWADLLLGERAVVGVWDQRLGVSQRHPDGTEVRSVRAVVLDWGCEPGAEDELLSLLRAHGARLAATGTTHLALFTSPPSPGRDVLARSAVAIDRYHVVVQAPEPEDLADRGIHVDPIWF